jgi:hypothetical protein
MFFSLPDFGLALAQTRQEALALLQLFNLEIQMQTLTPA